MNLDRNGSKPVFAFYAETGFFCLVKIRLFVHINNMERLLKRGVLASMRRETYEFADLDNREDLLQELRSLESRMKHELGYDVALIAYTPGDDSHDK